MKKINQHQIKETDKKHMVSMVENMISQLTKMRKDSLDIQVKYGLNKDFNARNVNNKYPELYMKFELLRESEAYEFGRKAIQMMNDNFDTLKKITLELIEHLDKAIQKKLEKEINAIELEKIHTKTIINTKEFEERFGILDETQGNLRERRDDFLPHYTLKGGRKIYYEVKVIEEWLCRNKEYRK